MDALEVAASLRTTGYVMLRHSVEAVELVAGHLGHIGRWQRVEPTPKDDAGPRTFSALYGFDSFPWHTDGAIAKEPPRYVVLASRTANSTPTELLDLELHPDIQRALRSTVLRVRDKGGRIRYERGFVSRGASVRYRWDPTHCEPVTGRASRLLGGEGASADYVIHWKPGTAAIFDNWRLLHRRPPLADADLTTRSLDRLYVYPAEG